MSVLDQIKTDYKAALDSGRLEKLNGRRVLASISGGKDSAALSLFLKECGIEHERFFLDTGWEHPLLYEYLRGELTRVIGPVVEICAERKMEALVEHKGMFPSRTRRFCTQELKVYPAQKYITKRMEEIGECVNAVGIRHEESGPRSKMPEWEWSDGFDCEVWRPLIRWTVQDVIDIHHRHGLKPNPLYLMGAERVGCWPCIYARKSEIRLVAEKDPKRIDQIREWEANTNLAAKARYDRDRAAWLANPPPKPTEEAALERWNDKHERLILKPFNNVAFFQAKLGRVGTPWPIDRAVEWSKTSRGGKEFEPFTDEQDGCMRWGLCDTKAPESK